MKIILLIFLLFTLLNTISFADIIRVPTDTSSIQGGIDLASGGDTVLVAEDTYYENINFKGKAITVASHFLIDGDTTHIDSTIINGSQPSHPDSGSVIYFLSGEDTTSVLCGFTITGGSGLYYAVWNVYGGGGIYMLSGGKIRNNKITGNQVHVSTQHGVGGGIAISGIGNTIISTNTIKNNSVQAANPVDRISGGGGIFVADYNPIIVNNVITDNQAPYGAGIAARDRPGDLNFRLINNTIAANIASVKGGGVYLTNGHCTAINNIFWNNTAPDEPDIFYRGNMNITYSITQGVFSGVGNLQMDPLFEDSEYHISDASPAIDAGNPESRFNDPTSPDNPSIPLWPAKGGLHADMGAFGGNDTVNVEIEEYLVKKNFLYEQFGNMHYRFSHPLNYNSSSVYPLTIVLHGGGAEGVDNEKHLRTGLQWRINAEHYGYNDFTIVPQAPNSAGWHDANNYTLVYNIIRNTIENFPIDTTKIVVTGFSRGGKGTWQLLNLYPQLFSAAITISTSIGDFGENKHVPVWVTHGAADNINPVENSRNYISSFENTGLKAYYAENMSDEELSAAIDNNARLFYSQIEGAGHQIRRYAYEILLCTIG